MYQQFFYLTAGICLIITTIMTIFLSGMIIKRNFSGRSSRRMSRIFDRLERLEEKEFDFHTQKVELKIEMLTYLFNTLQVGSVAYERIKEVIEKLQEQLNESRD